VHQLVDDLAHGDAVVLAPDLLPREDRAELRVAPRRRPTLRGEVELAA